MTVKSTKEQINLILIRKLLPISLIDLINDSLFNFDKLKYIIYAIVNDMGSFIHTPYVDNPKLMDKECYEDLLTMFYNNKGIWDTMGKVQFMSQFLDTDLDIQVTKDFIVLKFIFGENDEHERSGLL